jgi:hypothetical protein
MINELEYVINIHLNLSIENKYKMIKSRSI